MAENDLIEVGQVLRPFGIRGEVKVRPAGEPEETLSGISEVYMDLRGRRRGPVAIERCRIQGRFNLVKFAGVDGPEQAELLRGATLFVPREALGPLPEGAFYFCDLLDCTAENAAGKSLGTVTGYVPVGDYDLLIVKDGERERLIPTQAAVLLEVDLAARRIRVAWNDEDTVDVDAR